MSAKFRAVIFDLDGTLLDTIEDIAGATNQVLEARGLVPFSIEETKILVGDGIDEMVRRAFALRGIAALSDADVTDIIQDYRREYQACWRRHSRPYPGVPELLGELARRGTRTAVLSNKSHAFTTAMTEELLAGSRFDLVRGAAPGVPLKPDPAPALAIAAELGVEPPACAFLGDTSVDMKTAAAAGMFAVGALWGFRTAGELLTSGAAALIASPLELLGLL
ncbi:MAG: HAD family hydrolase [Candidatus Aminicenantes bacterium]|nr:HAD family hydrolase [Candidatus Aminicenantes bacterium]